MKDSDGAGALHDTIELTPTQTRWTTPEHGHRQVHGETPRRIQFERIHMQRSKTLIDRLAQHLQAVDGHFKVLKGAGLCNERALQTLEGVGKPVHLQGADAVQLHSFRKAGGAGGGHTWYLAAGTHSKEELARWLAQVEAGQIVCLQTSSSGEGQLVYTATIVDGGQEVRARHSAQLRRPNRVDAPATAPAAPADATAADATHSEPIAAGDADVHDAADAHGTADEEAAAGPSSGGLAPDLPPEVLSALNAVGVRMATKVAQLRQDYDAAATHKRQAQHSIDEHDAKMAAATEKQAQQRQKRARLLAAVAALDQAIEAGAASVQQLEAEKQENEQAMEGLAEQEAAAKQALEQYLESLPGRMAAVE